MTDHVNRRPREQESLMEKMLQMCSGWNWDQPTSEKFPVLELLRHSFGESQTLPGMFMDHPGAWFWPKTLEFLEIIDFWVYHPWSIKCVWLAEHSEPTLGPCVPFYSAFVEQNPSPVAEWAVCCHPVPWGKMLKLLNQTKNFRGEYSQCWLTQGCCELLALWGGEFPATQVWGSCSCHGDVSFGKTYECTWNFHVSILSFPRWGLCVSVVTSPSP